MNKEIYIQQKGEVTEIAILENKVLTELHFDENVNTVQEGDIYLGSVTKVLPGINSAFVDIAMKKPGFLHYSDLGMHVRSLIYFAADQASESSKYLPTLSGVPKQPPTLKDGAIADVLSNRTMLPVQISKEPIATKGARLSADLSFAGRYIVLVPFSDRGVSVSKKIYDTKERARLQKIVTPLCQNSFSIIVRTASVGVPPKSIQADIHATFQKWNDMCAVLKGKHKVCKLHSENQRIFNLLRDYLSSDFQKIVTNSKDLYNAVKSYVAKISTSKRDIVELVETASLFDHFNITKQIKIAFSERVPLENGGHLVIQQTEAMHVIDVNSGFKVFAKDQETNAYENNVAAAKEVVRQIRLRDLGGIIVIDFIDMRKAENRKAIYDLVRQDFKDDRARQTVLPLSKFGVMQITRQRVRPEVKINTSEACPSCNGTGKIYSHSLIIEDEIVKTLDYLFTIGHKKVSVQLHPIICAYLRKGFIFNLLNKWRWKYKKWITFSANPSLHFLKYKMIDAEGKEIKLKKIEKNSYG